MSNTLAPPDPLMVRPRVPVALSGRERVGPVRVPVVGVPDVSVCIANWNCRNYLQACLESLLDFPQGVTVEVIVADNASADGAADLVADEFPEVVLIRNDENLGFARASNQAAERAGGRYVFFLNNDTVVPPYTLSQLVAFADAHPQVGMIGPRLRDGNGKLQISYRRKPTLKAMLHRAALLRWTGLFRKAYDEYRRDGFDPDGVRRVDVLMGAAVLMPRRVYEECGGWDEGFRFGVEDVELSDRGDRSLWPGEFPAERNLRGPEPDDRLRPLPAQERCRPVETVGVQGGLHFGRAGATLRQVGPVPLAAGHGCPRREGREKSTGAPGRVAVLDARTAAILAGLSVGRRSSPRRGEDRIMATAATPSNYPGIA